MTTQSKNIVTVEEVTSPRAVTEIQNDPPKNLLKKEFEEPLEVVGQTLESKPLAPTRLQIFKPFGTWTNKASKTVYIYVYVYL